jgi:uncharacterized membrane protein
MGNKILRVYLTVRNPRNFLILLCAYIVGSLTAHFGFGYDGDFGLTNLVLSLEASTAGAVLMMVAEESARATAEMLNTALKILHEVRAITTSGDKTLRGVLLLVEAMRDLLSDRNDRLKALETSVDQILERLIERGKT